MLIVQQMKKIGNLSSLENTDRCPSSQSKPELAPRTLGSFPGRGVNNRIQVGDENVLPVPGGTTLSCLAHVEQTFANTTSLAVVHPVALDKVNSESFTSQANSLWHKIRLGNAQEVHNEPLGDPESEGRHDSGWGNGQSQLEVCEDSIGDQMETMGNRKCNEKQWILRLASWRASKKLKLIDSSASARGNEENIVATSTSTGMPILSVEASKSILKEFDDAHHCNIIA
ncbi:hypothetical protein BS17DRAFT_765764 [Gyrodon lividus]|nr:hypothetical protein BS17DRAFT_765764 [Gyrodon lividus]